MTAVKTVVLSYDFHRKVGGISTVLELTRQLLIEENLEVIAVAPQPAEEEHHVSLGGASDAGDVHRGLASVANPRAAFELRKLLRTLDPSTSIVHFHGWTQAGSSLLPRTVASMGFTAVATAHDYSLCCPTGTYFDHESGAVCTRTPASGSCATAPCDRNGQLSKALRVSRQQLDRRVVGGLSSVRSIAAVSDHVRFRLEGWGMTGIRTISNPLGEVPRDIAPFERDGVVFVGRIAREKGILELAEATRALGLKLKVYGAGPLEDELLDLYPEIEFHGWRGRSETLDGIAGSEILAIPSLWEEPYGLVVDDAVLLGVPVVARAPSGSADKVKSTGVGTTFKTDLASAISELMQPANLDAAQRSCDQFRSQARSHNRRFVAETLDFYSSAMST